MSTVVFSDVATIQTIGSSHTTASASKAAVSATVGASKRRRTSILRVAAEQPELEDGEDQDDREQHPGHGRCGAELEEAVEGRLVEVLHDRARRIARPAASEDEHLPEELE